MAPLRHEHEVRVADRGGAQERGEVMQPAGSVAVRVVGEDAIALVVDDLRVRLRRMAKVEVSHIERWPGAPSTGKSLSDSTIVSWPCVNFLIVSNWPASGLSNMNLSWPGPAVMVSLPPPTWTWALPLPSMILSLPVAVIVPEVPPVPLKVSLPPSIKNTCPGIAPLLTIIDAPLLLTSTSPTISPRLVRKNRV